VTPYAVGWWLLIIAGLLATLIGLSESKSAAVACGLTSGLVWVVYAGLTNHYRGLARRVANHLGRRWAEFELLSHPIPRYVRADLQLTLDALLAADRRNRRVGIRAGSVPHYPDEDTDGESANDLLRTVANNPPVSALAFTRLPAGGGSAVRVATNALYLLRVGNDKAAVLPTSNRLDVLADSPEAAQRVLDFLLDDARRRSVYRGKAVVLRQSRRSEDDPAGFLIDFHDLPAVSRDDLVLPAETLAVLDRNVSGWLSHTEALAAAGLRAGHGVLLHGPPGTGKSLAVKYLAGSVPGATVVLLTGRQVQLVRESCRMARLLAPSVLVLEDVDLIATDREQSRDTTLLHDLMDELDGLGPRAAVVVLLTTNRPEVLERALAARPGRVDQAVEFTLPDAGLRRRLLETFGRKLDLSAVDLGGLADRTAGASPAFLGELVRKAVVVAAERGESARPTDADFAAATRELLEAGGDLTRNLLGYRRPG
jgi:ATP-dependent 26S proteasome regulatory subunit